MKKLLFVLIIVFLVLPSQAALWEKKDQSLDAEMEGKGYAGTLPDLDSVFEKSRKTTATPIYEAQDGFNNPSDLKPIPRDNPSFVNIIQKKDKTSNYIVDANEIIPLLEKLIDCIEEGLSLQVFATRANVLTLNLDHLSRKYDGQPESYYESFRKLMEINQYTKTIAQLRKEAVTYQRYLSYQTTGSIYNPENINQQLEYLKDELYSTIILLKEED